ncbi:MAG: c-type cytochrome, partial [Verrucomicrobiales bacterium]|nr:c-type cytochrome [Verrucomicrobiales bacterium]
DADMEWDMNTPWYRPTRICQVLSGSDFGWRNGSAKWPVRWEDGAPPVVDIGPGSPTGVTFGYGAKFPAKYQEAFYAADWSYGKLYAVHLKPQGAGYTAEFEEFISGQPLPLTDMVVNPADGALYISIGGRRTQSGLYRVTYEGTEDTTPQPMKLEGKEKQLHALRRELESHHGHAGAEGLELAWKNLGHEDRIIRNAARIVVESNPVGQWRKRALNEKDNRAALTALMALIRTGEASDQPAILDRLNAISLNGLNAQDTTTLARNYALAFARLGKPDAAVLQATAARFALLFPHADVGLSEDLCDLLVYCNAPEIVVKTVPLLQSAPTQEEQISYAKALRLATVGWTPELRKNYFEWFLRAANYTGGASFGLFIEDIKRDAIAALSPQEKEALKEVINAKPTPSAPKFAAKALSFQKVWTLADLEGLLGAGFEGGRNFENGRDCFGAVGCFACHRFNQEGGAVGPDLTSVSGKFSPRDLLESVLDPSKEISDQYGSIEFKLKDGKVVIGRIMNMKEDNIMVNTNMMDPNANTTVNRADIVSMDPSKVSMMPPGLLNTLTETDILDLLAYLLSKGDPQSPYFSTK